MGISVSNAGGGAQLRAFQSAVLEGIGRSVVVANGSSGAGVPGFKFQRCLLVIASPGEGTSLCLSFSHLQTEDADRNYFIGWGSDERINVRYVDLCLFMFVFGDCITIIVIIRHFHRNWRGMVGLTTG